MPVAVKKRCFRIVNGKHKEDGRVYHANTTNDIIETTRDLNKLNRGSIRFRQITKGEAQVGKLAHEVGEDRDITREDLESLGITGLVQLAESEEVDLEGVTEESTIIDKVLATLEARKGESEDN